MKQNVLLILIIVGSLHVELRSQDIIHHKRQFRGVWVATVRNLDWPSKPGLSIRKLKKEYTRQLDRLSELNMNVAIVQVRPTGDSFYPSTYEPWSVFITGVQGKPPKKSWDPLQFMIDETHKRSMEFHAWFNPYRAVRNVDEAQLDPAHPFLTNPEWFVRYGPDIYFDPGMVPARKFVERVIADLVSKYDVDGVHFDDYYYPYRLEGIEFPDSVSFDLYGGSYVREDKGDWRRNNINLLVTELLDTINQIKPWVHFGISPFGVWRNKSADSLGSDTHTIQTNYDDLYGDSRAWAKNGWLDYITPQCYQYMGRPIMDYRILTQWWSNNHGDVNYFIGQGPFRLGNPDRGKEWTIGNEIDKQMYYNDSVPELQGSAFFRSQTFMENPLGINDSLSTKFYRYPSIPPVSHHDKERSCGIDIQSIKVTKKRRKIIVKWNTDSPNDSRYFVFYKNEDVNNAENILRVTSEYEIELPTSGLNNLHMTVIDRYRHECEPIPVVINVNRQ